MIPYKTALNDRATPAINILQYWGRGKSDPQINVYVDPIDGIAFNPHGLNYVEKGYFAEYFLTKNDGVNIRFPYRVAEQAEYDLLHRHTASAISPIKATSRRPQTRLSDGVYERTHPLPLGLSNFRVPVHTWDACKCELEKAGWEVTDVSVTEDALRAAISAFDSIVKERVGTLLSIRSTVRDSNTDWSLPETSPALLEALRASSGPIHGNTESRHLASLTQQMYTQPNHAWLEAATTADRTRLLSNLETYDSVDIERLYREIAHATSTKVNTEKDFTVDLAAEIAFLKSQFPALRRVSVNGKSLEIDLSYVKITLNPGSVVVDGDVTRLASFKSYDASTPTTPEPGSRLTTVLSRKLE